MRTRKGIEAEMAKLQKELDELPDRPAEPDNDPAVVLFSKSFGKEKAYLYVAVKIVDTGMWFITGSGPGRNPAPKTWDDLLDFIVQAEEKTPTTWVCTEVAELEW